MAKTILAISLLVGAGACTPAPTSNPSTTTTGPTTEPSTTTTVTEPPTTTTSEVPETTVVATTAPPTTRARSAPTTASTAVYSVTLDYGPLLACIRKWEQGADGYATDTGNGFFGAYQFDLATWISVGGSGNPAHAAPAEQDRRAIRLYERDGLDPWPTPAVQCRRYEP